MPFTPPEERGRLSFSPTLSLLLPQGVLTAAVAAARISSPRAHTRAHARACQAPCARSLPAATPPSSRTPSRFSPSHCHVLPLYRARARRRLPLRARRHRSWSPSASRTSPAADTRRVNVAAALRDLDQLDRSLLHGAARCRRGSRTAWRRAGGRGTRRTLACSGYALDGALPHRAGPTGKGWRAGARGGVFPMVRRKGTV